jgi:hypothetical protein
MVVEGLGSLAELIEPGKQMLQDARDLIKKYSK